MSTGTSVLCPQEPLFYVHRNFCSMSTGTSVLCPQEPLFYVHRNLCGLWVHDLIHSSRFDGLHWVIHRVDDQHKTVEIKVFLHLFACRWKVTSPDPDPDPGGSSQTCTSGLRCTYVEPMSFHTDPPRGRMWDLTQVVTNNALPFQTEKYGLN